MLKRRPTRKPGLASRRTAAITSFRNLRRRSRLPPQASSRWLVAGERNSCRMSSWLACSSTPSRPASLSCFAACAYSPTNHSISQGCIACGTWLFRWFASRPEGLCGMPPWWMICAVTSALSALTAAAKRDARSTNCGRRKLPRSTAPTPVGRKPFGTMVLSMKPLMPVTQPAPRRRCRRAPRAKPPRARRRGRSGSARSRGARRPTARRPAQP